MRLMDVNGDGCDDAIFGLAQPTELATSIPQPLYCKSYKQGCLGKAKKSQKFNRRRSFLKTFGLQFVELIEQTNLFTQWRIAQCRVISKPTKHCRRQLLVGLLSDH